MSGSVNKVIIVGRAGRDPEIRHTQSGGKIVNLTVATSETWNDRQSGERKQRTEWHRVVIFNEHLAGIAERFVKKGSSIYIEGELRTRKWTDQSGVEKYTTEVTIDRFRGSLTLLDSRGNNGDGQQQGQNSNYGYGNQGRSQGSGYSSSNNSGNTWGSSNSDLDDEIPF